MMLNEETDSRSDGYVPVGRDADPTVARSCQLGHRMAQDRESVLDNRRHTRPSRL